jgi:hypothetical protein
MQSNPRIQALWLKLLEQELQPSGVAVEKVEDGYFLVVAAGAPGRKGSSSPSADFQALESRIPNLERTRAVYLNSAESYHLSGPERLRDWAGDLAAQVESGARHALAVVEIESLSRRVEAELSACGWAVERTSQELKASDSHFTEPVNLLRQVVRMVLSRADMAECVRVIARELEQEFARDAEFFALFRGQFEGFEPATLGHFFVVHPESSCLALGWDYWQLSGHTPEEAARVFTQGMCGLENLLHTSPEAWLAGFPFQACGRVGKEN